MANEKQEVKKTKKAAIESPWHVVGRRLKKNKLAMVGLVILILVILFCVVGPYFSPYTILENNIGNLSLKKAPPSSTYILGTDESGRDVLLRLMIGGRYSIMVGLLATAVSVALGTIIGAISGFYGKWIDNILMRVADIFLAIPTFPILLLLAALLSDLKVPGDKRIFVVMGIIGILSWASLARLIRGQILALREQEFMQATEALGIRDRKKIFKHLIPNVVPTIIVSATLGIGGAILTESALSFLGLGVIPPTPTWGNMIQTAKNMIDFKTRVWLWIPPGTMIFLTIMAINLLGDGLRDALDPKLKK